MPPGSHQLVFGLWQFEGLYGCLLRCITQTHTCWFMLSDRLWNPEAYYLSANSIRSQCCERTQWDAWLMQPHKQASEKFKRMAWVNFHTMNFLETAFFPPFFFFFKAKMWLPQLNLRIVKLGVRGYLCTFGDSLRWPLWEMCWHLSIGMYF